MDRQSEQALTRRAKLLLGMALVLLLFLGETWVADRQLPNPLSPYVWTGLGLGIVACLAGAAWCGWRARAGRRNG